MSISNDTGYSAEALPTSSGSEKERKGGKGAFRSHQGISSLAPERVLGKQGPLSVQLLEESFTFAGPCEYGMVSFRTHS